MEGQHYPAANYNTEVQDELPDIADSELLHMDDEEIRKAVLESMEEGPSNDVPEDMGRANYQPTLNAEPKEADQETMEDHIQELINHRNVLEVRAGIHKIGSTSKPENDVESPESKRAA